MSKYTYISDEHYAIAEKNGISKATLRNRVRLYNWDIETAITTPVRKIAKTPKGVARKLRDNKIDYKTYKKRIQDGWTVEEACTVPPRQYRSDGEYLRARRKAESLGINYFTFTGRLRAGYTLEEASTLLLHERRENDEY